jgi:protein-S-isoprenylcysteine O-methyltransferase Ste14
MAHLLAISYAVFGLLCFGLRVVVQLRLTGKTGIALSREDNAHGFITRMGKGLLIFVVVYIANYVEAPEKLAAIAPNFFDSYEVQIAGIALIWLASILCFWAQMTMRESWRIGIDRSSQTELVERGVFRFSRNPIYLAIMFCELGLFLVLPNWISLSLCILGITLMQIEVRLEEEFLLAQHSSNYTSYCSRVRRWI